MPRDRARRAPTPTGRRSPASTASSPPRRARPSSSSTARSRSRWPTARRRAGDRRRARGVRRARRLPPAPRHAGRPPAAARRRDEAAVAYRRARTLARTDAERRYLSRRLDSVEAPVEPAGESVPAEDDLQRTRRRPRLRQHHRRRQRPRGDRPHHRAGAPRRGPRVPTALVLRAPQHPVAGVHGARADHRPRRSRDLHAAGRGGRHHAAQPLTAEGGRDVPHPRGDVPRSDRPGPRTGAGHRRHHRGGPASSARRSSPTTSPRGRSSSSPSSAGARVPRRPRLLQGRGRPPRSPPGPRCGCWDRATTGSAVRWR